MKNSILLVLLSFTLTQPISPAFADNHGGDNEDRYVSIKRPNLVVPDLDAALEFYVGHLGFKFAYAEDSAVNPESNFAYGVFNFDPTKAIRQATLNTSTEERGFALTEVVGLEAEISRAPSLSTLVVQTKRFMDLRADLIADGYTVTDFNDTSKKNPNGMGILEMGVLDPAGHLIVVFQYVGLPEVGLPEGDAQ